MADKTDGEPSSNTDMVFIDMAFETQQELTQADTETSQQSEEANIDISPSKKSSLATKGRLQCPECQRYSASTEERLIRHIRKVHRGENPFQCFMCEYSTYNKIIFEEHVRIHQGIKPFKCSHCPYRSVSKKNKKKHELIHRPDNPHRCDKCGFIARHIRSLKHHEQRCNNDYRKQCSLCNENFYNERSYDAHKKGKKRCPECSHMLCKTVFSSHRLENHGISSRSRKPAAERSKMSKKAMFTCSICGWEGFSKMKTLLHLIHHPDQMVDKNVVDTRVLTELGVMVDACQVVD